MITLFARPVHVLNLLLASAESEDDAALYFVNRGFLMIHKRQRDLRLYL